MAQATLTMFSKISLKLGFYNLRAFFYTQTKKDLIIVKDESQMSLKTRFCLCVKVLSIMIRRLSRTHGVN